MRDLLRLISLQWRYHRLAFSGGVLIALVPAIAGIALLGVAGWFITAAALAGLSGALLNIFLPSAIIRGLAIARTAGRYGERIVTHDATFRFLTDLRGRIFEGQARTAGNGYKARSGVALNRLTSDITALDAVYLRLVVPIALALVIGLLALIWTAAQSPLLALGPALVLGYLAAQLISSVARHKGRGARRQEAALDAVRLRTVDLVAGRRDLAVYGGLRPAADTVRSAHERLAQAEEQAETSSSWGAARAGFAGQVAVTATLAIACWLAAADAISTPVAVAAVLIVLGLPEVLAALMPGLAGLGRTRLAAGRAVSRVQDMAVTSKAQKAAYASLPEHADGDMTLAFENVSFGYAAAGRKVLDDLSCELKDGEWLAVVGRSGCGKSTVSALACGLLAPDRGRILLSGVDIAELAESNLRQAITVIGQRPYLFNDTLAANLRIAAPQATDEMLWKALDMAALSDRVRQNAAGLETVLGEGGIGLSGGEQRRLGLARAYLTQPKLFILDEFTEGLDAATADEVLRGFQAFRGNAAVLMIAHKPAEIAAADRVLRLDAAGAKTGKSTPEA
ncbi:thiol reductant ABC exporter subunit CydC [Roseibium sp.]|uniref:thiol reductant ABC exporter subunit CydC n=1 Tax=Roseibium sp. TaxID=1936156 RepID=UPI003A981F39